MSAAFVGFRKPSEVIGVSEFWRFKEPPKTADSNFHGSLYPWGSKNGTPADYMDLLYLLWGKVKKVFLSFLPPEASSL